MKIFNYIEFINESNSLKSYHIPTYEEAVEMCSGESGAFYETKTEVDGFPISIFNYRLAQWKDFENPIPSNPDVKGFEMRGITFVFNKDGTLFNRYVLLEKFFNLNQVPDSMYSVVKDYKIRYVNNKEDGSIASFVKLPNGKIIGKSKIGFDNEQAAGINRIYKTNTDVKIFVDWCLNNEIVPIFEYVAPHNRIVLRYSDEELILLRLRDNKTGKHIDIKEHIDKIGSIKIAPFEDDHTLDDLIEKSKSEAEKEGWIVQFDNDHLVKIKTDWYCQRHGLLTNDIYREHIIIEYILDDKIDDILGQIPEEEVEAHERIEKIISIVKKSLLEKELELKKDYKLYLDIGNRKDFALKYRKHLNFGYIMAMLNGNDPYELSKTWLRDKTKRLMIAREWLTKKDPTLFFQDPEESDDDN